MLRLFHQPRGLNFDKLCAVYRESNSRSGEKKYPREEPSAALRREEEDFEEYIREVFFRAPGAICAVWEEEGKYRSALRLEPYRDGLLLTSLETAPDQRRKGYGEKLVQAAIAACGKPVYAHVYKGNHPSVALHEKCGFRRVLDYAVFLDGTVTQRAWTFCRH